MEMVHPSTAHDTAAAPTAAATPHATHAKPRYMLVFGVLGVLTVVEVGITFIGLSKKFTIFALLLLALWKAVLVALYYMHLRFEPTRLRLLVLAPLPLAVILVVAVLTEF
jgi:cytochrome c oxidase subunit 4